MSEIILTIEKADSSILFGVNNAHIHLLKSLFPKLRLAARGNLIKAMGEAEQLVHFEESIRAIDDYCATYNQLTEQNIIELSKGNTPAIKKPDNLILFGINGKPIQARTKNQQVLVSLYETNDMLFAMGPAGSGKTYTAIALAVRALKNKEVRRIILCRPAVEAGEKLGFLPGDMKEKIDPYLQPLYDALQDMLPATKLKEFMETNVIQIAPLAFMRGRTLSDAVVILDEAQNTTPQQIKMFLTRLGMNAKMIITGDLTQIDLPRTQQSGLLHATHILTKVKGIGFVTFDKGDIVRHSLVERIVNAYEQEESKEKKKTISKLIKE